MSNLHTHYRFKLELNDNPNLIELKIWINIRCVLEFVLESTREFLCVDPIFPPATK